MRVLHVIGTSSAESGGPIAGVTRIAESCGPLGYHVEVACLDTHPDEGANKLPFPVYALGPRKGNYGYAPRMLPWLKENLGRYDGVVINGIWQYHSLAAWRAARGRLPYFVFTHGMLDPWFKRQYPAKHIKKLVYWTAFENRILNEANAVLFTTQTEMVQARTNFPFHRWTGIVVPYGALGPEDDMEDGRAAFYSNWPLLQGRRLLLYLGRIHEKKGCDLLIRAFAEVSAQDPAIDLVMAGPDAGGLAFKLDALAQELGVRNRIHWTGMLSGPFKWGAFAACEAFVLPSHQENFGISVAEALASSRPVLISDKVNICAEILEDKVGLVEEDTLEGTTRLLRRFLALPESTRREMGTRAIQTFNARYNIQNCGRKLLQLFEQANGVRGLSTPETMTPLI